MYLLANNILRLFCEVTLRGKAWIHPKEIIQMYSSKENKI